MNKYLIIAVVGLVGFGWFQWDRASDWKKESARLEQDRADLQASLDLQAKQIQGVADLDQQKTDELNKLRADVDRLERSPVRVFVKGSCPTTASKDSGSSLGNATGAEVSGDARAAYFDLRREHATAIKQIETLQALVRQSGCFVVGK